MIRQGTHAKRDLIQRARHNRRHMSEAVATLWHMFRDRELLGVKFRREHQIGHFIVDFYSIELKLVIECDGEPHFTEEGEQYDHWRSRELEKLGIRVVRFENREVVSNPRLVREKISSIIDELRGRLSPLPGGERSARGES